jgi:Cft2 family RNA processing exonuclease
MLERRALESAAISADARKMLRKKRLVRLHYDSSKSDERHSCSWVIDKLSCRHLEFFPNPQMLLQTYSSKDPKLILAVPASFSHGPSRLLFADFAAVPDNVILLTGRGEERMLGRMLFEHWNNSQRAEDKWDKGKLRLGISMMLDGSLELRVCLCFIRLTVLFVLMCFWYSSI